MKSIARTLASVTLALGIGMFGAGGANAEVIDFNNTVATGSDPVVPVMPYLEDGFRLRNGNTGDFNGLFDADFLGLGRSSDYFGWVGEGGTFIFENAGGAAFALNSMELGATEDQSALEFSIVGHLVGGGIVSMTGSSANLNTVTFGGSWSNVTAVEVTAISPNGGAVDNITVNVPEPGSLALLGLALAGIGFARAGKRKLA